MSALLGLGGAACIALAVLGGLIVLVGGWFMLTYNGLVQLRNAVKNAWSQIDVQLKRRYDLIPNLVETVKGYAGHEKETLERVVQARQAGIAAATVKDQAAAENMITGALRQLFALSEAYPNLKANENFLKLQEELASTENKIGFARQYYNDAVQTFNTRQEMFPANLVASMLGFQPAEFFEIEDAGQREAPKVKF
ncbi:MAG: LemA family protein [Planctomycetota bacterium]|jgi:LemA protein|nr:LemA family protein [Planctomycetota bacterium]